LVVIATVYTESVTVSALAVAAGFYAAVLAARALGLTIGGVYFVLGIGLWVALLESGVEPVIAGLAMGLLAYAHPAARSDLDLAAERFREFREQPTPELERTARQALRTSISANDRLARLFHPWTSYVIVPLFALANAGIAIDGAFLERAISSPITLGVLVGYVVGKPVGIAAGSLLGARASRGRVGLPVGWGAITAGGTIAGIGFTVALLVATLAFDGSRLEEAKLGILGAAACAALITWVLFRGIDQLPAPRRDRLLLGRPDLLTDLAVEVDPDRDHFRGPRDGPVTVVEYGDFECPYCGRAEPVVRELLGDFADVRYVWRHLPLTDVHPHAQLAAEAAEAAADQGAFWEMHDQLLAHQDALEIDDLFGYADELGLDRERFARCLSGRRGASRVADDVDGADLSGVSGTPTFFINGRRHYGAYDIATLSAAVREAGARARVAASSATPAS
jgi:protein-disulfide isomerase